MDKTNLVILKGSSELKLGSDTLYPNKYYRCLKDTKNDRYFVDGINMSEAFFKDYFEYAYDRIIRDWESIGLIVDGKIITKKAFGEMANIHTYGKQTNNIRIILFGKPKECMYGFYPPFSENKVKQLDHMYTWYKEVVNGGEFAIKYFDNQDIQFGNGGIPLCFGNLRIR
jgi:hypothetical protein